MRPRLSPLLMLGALGALIESNHLGGPRIDWPAANVPRRPRRYRRGPCEICGKPDVRAGRERGVYRCQEHMEDQP